MIGMQVAQHVVLGHAWSSFFIIYLSQQLPRPSLSFLFFYLPHVVHYAYVYIDVILLHVMPPRHKIEKKNLTWCIIVLSAVAFKLTQFSYVIQQESLFSSVLWFTMNQRKYIFIQLHLVYTNIHTHTHNRIITSGIFLSTQIFISIFFHLILFLRIFFLLNLQRIK